MKRTVDARGVVTIEGVRYSLYSERPTRGECWVDGWKRDGVGADTLGPGAWVTVGHPIICPFPKSTTARDASV